MDRYFGDPPDLSITHHPTRPHHVHPAHRAEYVDPDGGDAVNQSHRVHGSSSQKDSPTRRNPSHADESPPESTGYQEGWRHPGLAEEQDRRCVLHRDYWYAPTLMAKAKRRKLRARRRKANHGRRPNAGRGT